MNHSPYNLSELGPSDMINLVSVSILSGIIFFIVYWFFISSPTTTLYFKKRYTEKWASIGQFLFQKGLGFTCLGVLPLIICLNVEPTSGLSEYGLGINPDMVGYSFRWFAIISVTAIPLVIWRSKQPKNLEKYPQIRWPRWDVKIALINIAGWALYLLGYELLFRGIFLFPLAEHLGVSTAIAINIALYAATHIPKGLDETIGSFFLGLVLCVLTLTSGMIWIAFGIHFIVAMTNSFTALRYHPGITFNNRW